MAKRKWKKGRLVKTDKDLLEASKAAAKHRYIFDNRNFSVMWGKIVAMDRVLGEIKDRHDYEMLCHRTALRIEYGA